MEATLAKNLKKPILLLQTLLDGRVAAIDSHTNIYYFDSGSFELLDRLNLNIVHPYYKDEVCALSWDGGYLALMSADMKASYLYTTQKKEFRAKIERHHGEVSCVGIDPLSRYMFSCGDDGKTFAIDLISGKLAFTLPIHVDRVNAIACSKNANWLATASYDKKISLFNLATMSPKAKLRLHTAAVVHLSFFHQNKLVSIDKNSTAIIWNISTNEVIARLEGIHDDVTKMLVSGDEAFLFLGTKLGYVLVYDLHSYKLLSNRYIKLHSSITAIAFDQERDHLILGCEDGSLYLYNIYDGEKELKEFLLQQKFDQLEKVVQSNPMLRYTKIFHAFDTLWQKGLQRARLALEGGENKKAELQLEPFKDIPVKKRAIKELFEDYAEFDKFALFIKQGKFALAYALASKHPAYRSSKLFESLEMKWKKSFQEAQRWTLQPRGSDKAKEILAPFRGVSEKTKLIQELLTQGEVYKRFRASISQKEFKMAFELLKQHPFLYEFSEYEMLMNYADRLYMQSQEFLAEGDMNSAIRVLDVLCDFADFSDEAKLLTKEIVMRQKFFRALEEDEYAIAYNMLAESEELQETQDGKILQEEWNNAVALANEHAVKGDAKSLKKSLQKYMKISSKYVSIGRLFAWCYLVELEEAVREKRAQQEIENGIKNYILSFGVQEQIEDFFTIFKEEYPNSKISLKYLKQGSFNIWRPSMILTSILD